MIAIPVTIPIAVAIHIAIIPIHILGMLQPGASSLRFLGADDMQALLGVGQGSVTPLAVLNNSSNSVKVLLSQIAANASSVLLHPLSNEATMKMSPEQLQKFVEAAGNEFEAIDLDKEPAAAPPKKAKEPKAKSE